MLSSHNNTSIRTTTIPVLDMSCASCAASVESLLSNQAGVDNAVVNFANNTVTLTFDPTKNTLPALKKAVQSIGYDLMIDDTEKAKENLKHKIEQQHNELKKKTIGAAILCIPLLLLSMIPVWMNWEYSNYIQFVLATLIIFFFGQHFFIDGWKQAKHKTANMNTLVAVSTGVAYLYSTFITFFPKDLLDKYSLHKHVYFESVGVIIAFILLGKLLEEKAKKNTSLALEKLIQLQPQDVAVLSNNGNVVVKKIAEISIGDIIVAKPGEKIAVDGIVVSGESYVDESMLTGEPIAVHKFQEQKVFAGTINQKGSLNYKAVKIGNDTYLAQIIKTVEEAQGSKAPIQQKVDKIAKIFVPTVISIAFISFILWLILGKEMAFNHAVMAFVTVMIIACPCALGLATPTAIMVSMGKAAQKGILIKDAEVLEKTHLINTIVLDKTGTITQGKPTVKEISWKTTPTSKLQDILYSIESKSEHPLATAIVNHLEKNAKTLSDLSIETTTGKGIQAKVENQNYFIGSIRYAKDILDKKVENESTDEATTIVYFFNNEDILAIIKLQDQIKENAKNIIEALKKLNITPYLLSGDSNNITKIVAQEVGIPHYKAEVLPNEKKDFIEKLQNNGNIVAMVGDGINDSTALAQSDVGIAMGMGSDMAKEIASVTIAHSNLEKIPQLIRLSRLTSQTIKQNLFWAFIYNVIGIPIAAGILYPVNGFLLNPMIAGACMALSSVSVIGNSLLLKLKK